MVVDSRGRAAGGVGQQARRCRARTSTLTIDLDLQQEAARWFDGPEKVGAVVAMDPRNGEILALVSAPSYNPNLFARRLQTEEWQALIDGALPPAPEPGDPEHLLAGLDVQDHHGHGRR